MITDADVSPPGPRITFVNRAFTRMTGYRAAEVLGQSPRFLQGPGTDPAVRARMRRALTAGRPVRGEITNYRKDGTPFLVQFSIAPLRDAGGRITSFVSVQRDVTAQHRLSHARFQGQHAADTAQLTLAIMHSVGNLYALVTGNLELIAEQTSLPRTGKRQLRAARTALDRALRQVRRLRTLRHLADRPPVLVDLNTVVQQTVDAFDGVAARHGVEILACVPATPCVVLVDPDNARDALVSLIMNACQATPSGGTIEVSVARTKPEQVPTAMFTGHCFQLAVADTGAGIPPAVQRRLFEPFVTTKHATGAGLGLYLVREFVRHAGGTVAVDSSVGEGTTVALFFPLGLSPDGPAADIDGVRGAEGGRSRAGKGEP